MRVAVLSDIHANLHAFEAALAAVDVEKVDAVWCLGDVVGYGPQPSRCCSLAEARTDICLVGNHDLGVLGLVDIGDFTPEAAIAARWTADALGAADRAFLASLGPSAEPGPASLFHASPRDPVWEYVLTTDAVLAALELAAAPIVVVGHSHVAMAFGKSATLAGGLAPGGTELDLAHAERWLLNPGSIGQPRDGDPRAGWLLLDLDAGLVSFRRADYPVERTQREIRDAGLPDSLATRLAEGS